MLNKLFITLVIFLVVACTEKLSNTTNTASSSDITTDASDTRPTLDATNTVDVGDTVPFTNLPDNWVYTQYPSVGNFQTETPCDMGLIGTWLVLDEFDGAFFRTEGGKANVFENDTYTQRQRGSMGHHAHHHGHSHNHDVDDTHEHEYEHKQHDHKIALYIPYIGEAGTDAGEDFFNDIWTSGGAYTGNTYSFGASKENLGGCAGYQSEEKICGIMVGGLEVDDEQEFSTIADSITTPNIVDSTYDETRPDNYTVRLWRKLPIDELDEPITGLACRQLEYAYDKKYIKRGKEQFLVQKQRKRNDNGDYLVREVPFDKEKFSKQVSQLNADERDAGSTDTPITNFPVNWIYEEYPMISTTDGTPSYPGNGVPCGEGMGLPGLWVNLGIAYEGAFLRTETDERPFWGVGSISNLLQSASLRDHDHLHKHPHKHSIIDNGIDGDDESFPNKHYHGHAHDNHKHDVSMETNINGKNWGIGLDNRSGKFPEDVRDEDNDIDGREDIEGNTSLEIFPEGHSRGFENKIPNENGQVEKVKFSIEDYNETTDNEKEFEQDNFTKDGTRLIGEEDDIRPDNYTVRLWKKVKNIPESSCGIIVYQDSYKIVKTMKEGKLVETKKILVSRKPKIDTNGNFLIKEYEPSEKREEILRNLVKPKLVITTEKDSEEII